MKYFAYRVADATTGSLLMLNLVQYVFQARNWHAFKLRDDSCGIVDDR